MKAGFVNIFGKPNAGKSTLLNALMGEKLAIVSPKVQTTRHRIKGILTEKDYQIILPPSPNMIPFCVSRCTTISALIFTSVSFSLYSCTITVVW